MTTALKRLNLILLIPFVIMTGCASSGNRDVSADAALNSPEARLISASGCSYESIQKVLFGLPQTASYEELKSAWGSRNMHDVKTLQGLPDSATTIDLYRKVIAKLGKDGCPVYSAT